MEVLTPSRRSDGSSSASEVGWSSVAAVMGRCFCSAQEGTYQEAALDSSPAGDVAKAGLMSMTYSIKVHATMYFSQLNMAGSPG